MLKLGIRVSSIKSSGKGHFQRCLSVRKNISKKVVWFLDYRSKYLIQKIPKSDQIFFENKYDGITKLHLALENKSINFVLIDNYNISRQDIQIINKKINTAVLIDDNKVIEADLIICPQPINMKILKGKKYLCGPKYAPISKLFSNNNIKNNFNNTILISFGAYDSKALTIKVIEAVKYIICIKKMNLKVLIALGIDSPIKYKVKEIIKELPDFQLILDYNNMSKLYKKSDIAVGACGVSYLERLASGLPSILIAQNKLHNKLIDEWEKLGCAIKSDGTIKSIVNNIYLLCKNKNLRKRISKKGMGLIDGKGSQRIAEEINKFVKST